MGCKCSEETTTLRCKDCGWLTTIAHARTENVLDKAKRRNVTCKKCFGTEFEVKTNE